MKNRRDYSLFARLQLVGGFLFLLTGVGCVGAVALNSFVSLIGGSF